VPTGASRRAVRVQGNELDGIPCTDRLLGDVICHHAGDVGRQLAWVEGAVRNQAGNRGWSYRACTVREERGERDGNSQP